MTIESHPTETAARINSDDFFSGFFAALATCGYGTVRRDKSFDSALASAFESFLSECQAKDLFPNFRIRIHRIHGDSVGVSDGIAGAARRDLISLDNPTFQNIRLKLTLSEADSILRNLPGGRSTYETAAANFLRARGMVD